MTPGATKKLFADIAPRFSDRAGGYTRIIHAGFRIGDGADLAILELLGSKLKKKEKKEKAAKPEPAEEEKKEVDRGKARETEVRDRLSDGSNRATDCRVIWRPASHFVVLDCPIRLIRHKSLQSAATCPHGFSQLPVTIHQLFFESVIATATGRPARRRARRIDQCVPRRSGAAGHERLMKFVERGISRRDRQAQIAQRNFHPRSLPRSARSKEKTEDKIFCEVRRLADEEDASARGFRRWRAETASAAPEG